MDVLQFHKLNSICCFTQRRTYGLQARCFIKALLKNRTVNCLTFEENTRQPYNDNLCIFGALDFRWHGNQRLEVPTSKVSVR